MNDDALANVINQLIDGTIGDQDHADLQQRLRVDSQARELFRERMDLEASLHTWASEDVPAGDSLLAGQSRVSSSTNRLHPPGSKWSWAGGAAAIAAVVLFSFLWYARSPDGEPRIAQGPRNGIPNAGRALEFGHLVQQADCRWKQSPTENGRFSMGRMELSAGAAELRFDSGTNVILEAPCALKIESADSARLLAGTVFVDVTEVSNGFLLTTPEANIVDEGTQYAVTLDSESTEVHVFDGSVIWTTTDISSDFEDRILSGEARRFSRTEPDRPQRIPFGKRQFVRRIEAQIRDAAGDQLLAYDGFENLAGKLRRGRSGFGWADGWEPAGRRQRQLAEVMEAPDDNAFGIDRAGRRLLSVQDGVDMRRRLAASIELSTSSSVYVSLLARRAQISSDDPASLQISLEPDSNSPRYVRRNSVSFGVTSTGAAYVNNAGKIREATFSFPDSEPCLLVLQYLAHQRDSAVNLRVYTSGDSVDGIEPSVWTVNEVRSIRAAEFTSIRLSAGAGATWQVDELKIGTSWPAVANASPLAINASDERE